MSASSIAGFDTAMSEGRVRFVDGSNSRGSDYGRCTRLLMSLAGERAMKTKWVGNVSWVLLVAALAVIIAASIRRADAGDVAPRPVNLTAGDVT